MRKLLTLLLVAGWLVEMSVMAGVEASRRPRQTQKTVVPPTPAPYRSTTPNCTGPQCTTPQPQLTPSRVIVSPR